MNYPIKQQQDSFLKKYFGLKFYKANLSLCIFSVIYFIIQVALVIFQVLYYIEKNANNSILVARAAGILLNFNMSFIILLVLRRCLTWLASMKLIRICLPFEDFIQIHKFIGVFILILGFIHTIAHSVNQCKYFIICNNKI